MNRIGACRERSGNPKTSFRPALRRYRKSPPSVNVIESAEDRRRGNLSGKLDGTRQSLPNEQFVVPQDDLKRVGLTALAIPISDREGRLIGAISIAGLSPQMARRGKAVHLPLQGRARRAVRRRRDGVNRITINMWGLDYRHTPAASLWTFDLTCEAIGRAGRERPVPPLACLLRFLRRGCNQHSRAFHFGPDPEPSHSAR